MYDELVQTFAKEEGCTEQLKSDNQMQWVQKMNNIRDQVTKTVNNKLIYT